MTTYRLGILTTHPIQYQVPWFRALAARPDIDLTVYYCLMPDKKSQGEGFGVEFAWDIPLLEGYPHVLLKNVAQEPGSGHFRGCDTPGIGEAIRRGGFDAFIVHGWVVKSCFQTLLACRRRGVPCLVRGDSNTMTPRPWWKRMIHRGLIRKYAACLYVGRSNADLYRRSGVSEERLFPVLHFVDNRRFAEDAALAGPPSEARRRWQIPETRTLFLYCAKFTEKKHPRELLAAVREASAATDRFHLLMVGDGRLRPACEAYVKEHGLPVTFAGFMNQGQIAAAYAAADCLVLPSDCGETWGLVVNEAMACGRPAIVSDQVGCWPDLIEPGRTGAVFPFGDWPALARLLASAAEDRASLGRQGEAARERVARYSIEAAVEGTLEALRYVCREGPET